MNGLFSTPGCPLERQRVTWRDMVQKPISKLDDDAYTRVRVILMNGIELEANRFLHSCARMNRTLQLPLAQIRRIEQHQATTVNWLLGADHSPLETTIAYEQVAIDITAAVAQNEPDEYLAQTYRYGLLEDFDHMYRYSALLDRLEGKDANNILQSYTDILPGRPTILEHRAAEDDLREAYDRKTAQPISKLHALTIMASEQQTHNYDMNVGPLFADPAARQLYAEIASIEEQHLGTVPPPGTAKGMLKTGLQMLTGTRAHVLVDKLGERLAFERSGTRLYDAMLVKCEAAPANALGPVDVARLRHIRDEEVRHFDLVMNALETLGADPTAQTPCADVTGVEGLGLLQTITDPRTSVAQCLSALLIAELTDQAAWDVLAQLARDVGQDDLATQFDTALAAETEHAETIRTWTARMTLDMARLGGQI